ncbi:MAG: hypothetical protein KAJ86_06825 [Alphaproteobacteria bacterium]|nr:hypothetical protein [Alphaproteobacteria bacterium]
MDWTQLTSQKAKEFIDQVASKEDATLFDLSACEVHTLPLSFYDGYSLYRIVNKNMIPHLTLDYLSNGENHYYMDGSENAFHNLNARNALNLDKNNVNAYMELYISYVYEHGNSFEFVHDQNERIEPKLTSIENNLYHISVPLLYQNAVVDSHIIVEQNGSIHIKKPTEVSFLVNLKPGKNIAYRHPLENKIIEESKALLFETKTGARLLEIAEKQMTQIRVLNSPNYHGFITNERICYIIMPAAEQTAKYLQAIILTGCLRDAEQIASRYIHPTQEAELDIYETVNFGKNLDMVTEMCKMVEELEDKGFPEGLAALSKLGMERVYKGYKNGQDNDTLMNTYIAALERHGILD